MDIVTQAVQGSSVADVAWLDGDGMPNGCGAVAFLWNKKPVLAFSYAYDDLARSIAAAAQVALVLTETRSTSTTFTPAALIGRPKLIEDTDGYIFADHLLKQELQRYPPARVYADSLVLRREHWWYLPRLIVALEVDAARPMPARSEAAAPTTSAEHLLAVAVEDRIEPYLVRVGDGGAHGFLPLVPVDDRNLPSGPAVLIGQDASFPDLAQWSSWTYRGSCTGDGLTVAEPPAVIGLEPIPSVWRRMRVQQAFGRACRAGIARAERGSAAE